MYYWSTITTTTKKNLQGLGTQFGGRAQGCLEVQSPVLKKKNESPIQEPKQRGVIPETPTIQETVAE